MPTDLTSESLEKLLFAFSPDEADAARRYTQLREALLRFFQIKGVADEGAAADETLDRVAEKLNQGAKIEELRHYAFGVARFVALEAARREKTHARVAGNFYLKDSSSDEFIEQDSVDHLRHCFRELYERERLLLVQYFEDLPTDELQKKRLQLAATEGVNLNALRNRISRLRRRLEDCLRGQK